MRLVSVCLAALVALTAFADDDASAQAKLFVYRGTFTDLSTGKSVTGGVYDMLFRFYASDEDGAPALAFYAVPGVPINPDGSFEAIVGDDDLAICVATGTVTHVGLSVKGKGDRDYAPELKPRRELRPVVGVNRALVADRGAPDLTIGILAASQLPLVSSLAANGAEISGNIVATNCGSIAVQPFSVHEGERTVVRRGQGVKVFGAPRDTVKIAGPVRQNQVLANAVCDCVALISSDDERMPGVVQFYGKGDEIRCPVTVGGEVRVTLWPFVQQ